MFTYKLTSYGWIIRSDTTQIPPDAENTDYQAYLAWLEAGNKPTPADEVTQ